MALPNGTQWTFSYNQYGDLQSLTYPTGATVTYGWTNGGGCGNAYARLIQSRTVNTGKRSDTWTYSYNGDSSAQYPWTTTETDPVGNKIVHGFQGTCSPELSTQYIDASAGPVSTTTYSYTQLSAGTSGPYISQDVNYASAYNQVQRKAVITLANGLAKQTCFIYDNDMDTACSGDQEQFGATAIQFYDDAVTQGYAANPGATPPAPQALPTRARQAALSV